ncbi:DUF4129 domain-containing protein [Hyalangium rubrum]|uniref:DUF4129 domain-containing protein n=1 Tax=Hyalangium rubrum TaxID=3103134 RepID=A0ABU5GWD6_9BACT|nr:DUF4129 domain-containing protein [Hyalangium sp. s54d21]MDY7225498.1 DUF4129 domain-containing protein [Hyalangium sp. s54d21]
MAVSALELRPRGAVAILDAALRLCSRNTGVWALTLPAGALVTGALFHLIDAVTHHRALGLPTLWLTLAWFARGIFQGAASHYTQELLLGQKEPNALVSLRTALARAPSLIIAVGYLFFFNLFTLSLSLGLSFFLLSAHVVGYAVMVQGRGSPMKLYGLCSRLLGPARATAVGVRMMLLVQVLTFFNLHIATNFFFWLARKLLAIDFTFAERFTSIDNPSWLLFLAAVTFTLFEPIKAASSTLLLVDGRVRQEGLDLLAAVQQLPNRSTGRAAARSAALVLLCVLFGGTAARAQEAEVVPPSVLQQRLRDVASDCEYSEEELSDALESTQHLGPAEQEKLGRMVRTVERQAYDNEDCEQATQTLRQGLSLASQTARLEQAQADSKASAARAKEILSRPEFAVDPARPEKAQEEETPRQPPGWWKRFMDWLEELFKRERERPPPPARDPLPVSGASAANALVVIVIGVVLAVLAAVLLRALGKREQDEGAQLEVSTLQSSALSQDPLSALSRPPEGWAHLADELAARGEYREAVRSLYLALLSRLHRDGAILYDSTLSNWDYLRNFKGRRDWLPPFRELTRRFDFAWYGNLPVGADGYRDFRALTQPMLSAPAPQEAAGA